MHQTISRDNKISSCSLTHLITDYRLLMTTLALALSGCMGVYEGGFECPPGEGVGCKSISEVNRMVDQCSVSAAQCPVPSILYLESEGTTAQIWYSPSIEAEQKKKRNFRCLDDANSI